MHFSEALTFCSVVVHSNLSERLIGRQTNNHAEIYVSKQMKSIVLYFCSSGYSVCLCRFCISCNCIDSEDFI